MEYTIEQLNQTFVAGIQTRTDNTKAMTLIPKIWEDFFAENKIEQIENKVKDAGLYAVYTDYESDEHGEYTFVIGAGVQTLDSNKALVNFELKAGSYAVFTAADKDQVGAVWQQIWQTGLDRTYISDFEYYDMTTGEVKIYVGVA